MPPSDRPAGKSVDILLMNWGERTQSTVGDATLGWWTWVDKKSAEQAMENKLVSSILNGSASVFVLGPSPDFPPRWVQVINWIKPFPLQVLFSMEI